MKQQLHSHSKKGLFKLHFFLNVGLTSLCNSNFHYFSLEIWERSCIINYSYLSLVCHLWANLLKTCFATSMFPTTLTEYALGPPQQLCTLWHSVHGRHLARHSLVTTFSLELIERYKKNKERRIQVINSKFRSKI